MKVFQILSLLLILSSCHQKEEFVKAKTKLSVIDSLTTKEEIENFIGKTDTLYKKFYIKKIQDIQCYGCDSIIVNLANKVNVTSGFEKADFDNNGLTDILVTGENKTYGAHNYNEKIEAEFSKDVNVLILMNFGQNKIKLYNLVDEIANVPLAVKIKHIKSEPFLMVHTPRKIGKGLGNVPEIQSKLTYKFDDFIEYNPQPFLSDIEKIEFAVSPCFGECPVFKMEINKNKTAKYLAEEFNYTKDWQKGELQSGKYTTTITDKEYEELFGLVNYMDFKNLNKEYHVRWSCDQSGTLKITYNDGKVKTISDYGLRGTYGLKRTYEIIFNLRRNQNWKK